MIDSVRLGALAALIGPMVRAQVGEVPGHAPLRKGETGTVEGATIHERPKIRPPEYNRSFVERTQPKPKPQHSQTRERVRRLRQLDRAYAKLAKRMGTGQDE